MRFIESVHGLHSLCDQLASGPRHPTVVQQVGTGSARGTLALGSLRRHKCSAQSGCSSPKPPVWPRDFYKMQKAAPARPPSLKSSQQRKQAQCQCNELLWTLGAWECQHLSLGRAAAKVVQQDNTGGVRGTKTECVAGLRTNEQGKSKLPANAHFQGVRVYTLYSCQVLGCARCRCKGAEVQVLQGMVYKM